jgi:hypothetical protein
MCQEGLGYWSPSLPARAGDTYDIGFYARGRELAPATGQTAVAAFAEFANATGQRRQRVDLAVRPLSGSFEWAAVAAKVKVPDGARRLRVFLGMRPSTGTLLIDDITMKVQQQ